MSHWLCAWAMIQERNKCKNQRNTRSQIRFVPFSARVPLYVNISPKGIVRFRSRWKAPPYRKIHFGHRFVARPELDDAGTFCIDSTVHTLPAILLQCPMELLASCKKIEFEIGPDLECTYNYRNVEISGLGHSVCVSVCLTCCSLFRELSRA